MQKNERKDSERKLRDEKAYTGTDGEVERVRHDTNEPLTKAEQR
jgi:hypothetical protein